MSTRAVPFLKVLLVDDHAVFRDALGDLLEKKMAGLKVVGGASTARAAMISIQELDPDLVILDVVMRGTNGISLARELKKQSARPQILILTAIEQGAFVADALAAGVTGYALKAQGIDELVFAIEQTARGVRYLAPAIQDFAFPPASATASDGLMGALSHREREVFDLAASGHSNAEIGKELFISIKTVETHRARINKKLHIHSTAQLMRLASLKGLVTG